MHLTIDSKERYLEPFLGPEVRLTAFYSPEQPVVVISELPTVEKITIEDKLLSCWSKVPREKPRIFGNVFSEMLH